MNKINVLAIFIGGLLVFASCSNKSTGPNNKIGEDIPSEIATEVFDKAPITKKGAPKMESLQEDCHGQRLVVGSHEEVNGTMLKVGDRYVITTEGGNNRYNPCKLDDKYKQSGLLVRFSGEILEIRPNERLVATPFRLRNIIERDN